MLVVALVGSDEGKIRKVAAGQIGVEGVKADDVLQAELVVISLLNIAEVGEGVVLHGVELRHAGLRLRDVGDQAVTGVDLVGAIGRQVLLIGLPGFSEFDELVGDSDAARECGRDRIIVDGFFRRSFVGGIHGWCRRVPAGSGNWARVGCGTFVCWRPGLDVWHAGFVVPVGRIVVDYAKVRSADNFQVVGEAGVTDCKVIGGEIGGLCVAVNERGVRVADDLGVVMILHQNHKSVIKAGNASIVVLSQHSAG